MKRFLVALFWPLLAAQAAGNDFVSVSSASGMPKLAAGSLATAFGPNLASMQAAGKAPFATSLGGVSLQLIDSTGNMRLAPLIYVSPTQINYLVPAGLAVGTATVNLVNAGATTLSGTLSIDAVAPALFTANGTGQGVVAATAYRTLIPTALAIPVPVYRCLDSPGSCVSVPLDLGLDAPVTVTLYATGLRGRSSDAAVKLMIGDASVPVRAISSLDDSGASPGLDLVVFELPITLRGLGEVNVVLSVDGASSNTGRINIL